MWLPPALTAGSHASAFAGKEFVLIFALALASESWLNTPELSGGLFLPPLKSLLKLAPPAKLAHSPTSLAGTIASYVCDELV
jgi:hypothetical protein